MYRPCYIGIIYAAVPQPSTFFQLEINKPVIPANGKVHTDFGLSVAFSLLI